MKFTITGILVVLIIVAMILLVIQRSMRKHIKNMNIVEEIKYE
jgi:type II secretory pathway pseudopilin PulG